ncbi:MAG: Zn-dependent exopeptidase M28 [bacterium]|nr:Zn-dependent exopeptidase M28 [bacterium]
MRRLIPYCCALLVLMVACSNIENPDSSNPITVAWCAGRVSEARLMADLDSLTSIPTRYMHHDPGTAATLGFLTRTLAVNNTPAHLDSFSFFHICRNIQTANVEVLFPGNLYPEREVLIGAHWDSIDFEYGYNGDSTTIAPGADDNGSGVVALLELARIIKDIPLENSVRLIFFAAEEAGLAGSRHTRERYRNPQNGDSLICLVNVDMIGYDADEHDAFLIYYEQTAALAQEMVDMARELTVSTTLAAAFHEHGSTDCESFRQYGLNAVWFHEGAWLGDEPYDAYPGANTATDTLGVINPEFLTDCTRALVGFALHLGVMIEPTAP